MELRHIAIDRLTVSNANMRGRGKADIANILPSVRARGVLAPLIVRQAANEGVFEIVAGKRRYHAALAVAQEAGDAESKSLTLPCAVMEAGDDAAALEVSLIENIARLDPDEVSRWETMSRLVREGRSPEQIALTFGLTELQVKRILALGNLLPRIRTLYRVGGIDAVTVQHLTLLSKARQRDWLALLDDRQAYCPMGRALKAWAMGGAAIPVSAALFDLDSYSGEIVADLFGEDRYFADVQDFWAAQNAAIGERAETYRAAGWREVVILEPGQIFHQWKHERTPKRKGGKAFIAVGTGGDVSFHEGYLTRREARQREAGETPSEKPVRPETSSAIRNYVDLHRHAAVRAKLASEPAVALRVAVAHMIAGSALWSVKVDRQRAVSDAVAEGVEACRSEAMFDEQRRQLLALLGFDPETSTVTGGQDGSLEELFAKLLALSDDAVLSVLAMVMGETLSTGTPLVEMLGQLLKIDMASVWEADGALLDMIKDRQVLDAIVTEVAGEEVATANATETGKVKRRIIRDSLAGNGRTKVERWVPRWMAFPPAGYTDRGGIPTVERAEAVVGLIIPANPMPVELKRAA